MKITKEQKEILELMNSGWELGQTSCGIANDYWVEEGGIGKGGSSKHNLGYITIYELNQLNLIEKNKNYSPLYTPTTYKLTEEGKKLLEELK